MNKKSSATKRKIVWVFFAVLLLWGQEYIFGALFVVSYMFQQLPNDNLIVAQNAPSAPPPQVSIKEEKPHEAITESKKEEVVEQEKLPQEPVIIPKSSNSSFSLQVASVANHGAAIKFAEKLKAKGYEPLVVAGEVGGKKVYRVRLQGFASYQEAERARNKFEQEEGARGLIIAQQS